MSKQKQIVELIRDYVKNTPLKGVHKIVIENEPEFSKYDKNTIRFYLTFIVDKEQSDFMEPIWKSKMNSFIFVREYSLTFFETLQLWIQKCRTDKNKL